MGAYKVGGQNNPYKIGLKNVTLGGLFSFIDLFCYDALTVKVEKTCNIKRCLRVVPIKCQRQNTIFKLIYTLSIIFIEKFRKKWGNEAFFKSEGFNCNVSFFRHALITVIVILRLKMELKCYC